MLAIKQSSAALSETTPHLLPCRVAHTGPMPASSRYWQPQPFDAPSISTQPDSNRVSKLQTQRAYFRGRRLFGRRIALPSGYKGLVVRFTEEVLEDPLKRNEDKSGKGGEAPEQDEVDADDEPEPVKAMEPLAAFDSVQVWGHEEVPAEDDTAVRGLSEWIGLAEAMHDFDGAQEWWKKAAS